jgi:hypothetical protein
MQKMVHAITDLQRAHLDEMFRLQVKHADEIAELESRIHELRQGKALLENRVDLEATKVSGYAAVTRCAFSRARLLLNMYPLHRDMVFFAGRLDSTLTLSVT